MDLTPFQRVLHFLLPTTDLTMTGTITLKPAQVSVLMVESAVAKHNTRADKTFLKAVSTIRVARYRSLHLCTIFCSSRPV